MQRGDENRIQIEGFWVTDPSQGDKFWNPETQKLWVIKNSRGRLNAVWNEKYKGTTCPDGATELRHK